jgi:hypothetical protein
MVETHVHLLPATRGAQPDTTLDGLVSSEKHTHVWDGNIVISVEDLIAVNIPALPQQMIPFLD